MRKLLVCQHVPFEILGTLDPLLRRAGFRVRYVNFGRHPDAEPNLSHYRGLIVLGGPMSVHQERAHPHLATEMRLIEAALQRQIPVLGICLGAQLIARTLGAPVGPNPEKEIGWYDVLRTESGSTDPLFAHFGGSERIFQWHGDTFEMPSGGVHLATSEKCANQAFRYGDRVYGFQFHIEVDAPLIERWLRVPAHRREIEELQGRIDPEQIRAETPAQIGRTEELSRKVFGEFIQLFRLPERRRMLPSR